MSRKLDGLSGRARAGAVLTDVDVHQHVELDAGMSRRGRKLVGVPGVVDQDCRPGVARAPPRRWRS